MPSQARFNNNMHINRFYLILIFFKIKIILFKRSLIFLDKIYGDEFGWKVWRPNLKDILRG